MAAEKGIFLDVLPRFDMAAMGAILTGVENMFKKSGAAMGGTFGDAAKANIAALAEAQRKASNVTADAELRNQRAIHGTEIAEKQREIAIQRTLLAKARLLELQASEDASTNSVTAAAIRYNAAKAAEARANYAAADAKSADIARTRDLAAATKLSNDAVDKHNAAVAASATNLTNYGRVAGVAGAAAVGGFALIVGETGKAAGDFQQSLVKLQASAGETGTMVSGNLKVVSDGILQLAGQVGVSAQQLADSMFNVEKAGYQGQQGITVLTAAAQLANAEGADLNDTIAGLTTSMHDFGYSADQAAIVASKLNVAAGDSRGSLQDFSESLHNVEPTAAAAKISIDEVYTAMTRITQSGASADQSSQWLNNTIEHMVNMNDQQKKALQQLGMNPVQLEEQVSDPNVGFLKTMNEINDVIKSKLTPNQMLMLDTQKKSVQAVQSEKEMYEGLDPAEQQVADKFKNGTASKQDLQDLRVGGSNDSKLREWKTEYDTINGFNDQLKKGQGDLTTAMAEFSKVYGTDSGLKVATLLFGTPEEQKATFDELTKLKTTTAEADGTVKGFNETQDTLNKRMADAKAAFGATAIQIGNDFLPALTNAANALKDVAQYLAAHKTLLDTVVKGIGLMGAAWLLVKGYNIGSTVFGAIGVGIDGALTKFALMKTAIAENAMALGGLGTTATAVEGEVATAAAAEVVAEDSVGTAAVGAATKMSAALGPLMAIVAVGTEGANIQKLAEDNVPGAKWLDSLPNPADAGKWVRDHLFGGDVNHGVADKFGSVPEIFGDQDTGPTVDHRGRVPGSAGDVPLTPTGTPSGVLPDDQTSIDSPQWQGAQDNSAATGAPAIGTQNNPIYTDPQSITDGLNASDLGSQGTVGGSLMSIFTDAGSGGFTLANLAKLLTTFTVNLALGNPAGKLATGQIGGDGESGADLTSSISDIENMSPTERIEKENTIKMQKAIRTYQNALRDYAKALQKYGPGSSQALDAEDSVFNARDAVDQTTIDQQQAGGTAAQNFANDQVNGTATKNPGKYAKDQAAAQAYTAEDGPGNAATGMKSPGTNSMSQDQVASAIIAQGQSMGMSKGQIIAALDTAKLESNYGANPMSHVHQNQAGTDVEGIFQQDKGYTGDHDDPTNASRQFYERMQQRAKPGDTPGQEAVRVQVGTYGGGYVDSQNQGPTYDRLVNGAGAPNATSTTNGGGGGGDGWGLNALPSIIPGSGGGNGFLGLRQAPMAPPPATPGGMSFGGGALPGASVNGGQLQSPGMKLGAPATGAPGAGRGSGGLQGSTNGAPIGAPAASPGGVGKTATGGLTTSQGKGGSGPGAGASGGGLLGGAIGAAESAANMFAPGAGAGIQIAAEEGERAAKFAGQAAGIAVQGLGETFTLHSPDGGAGSDGGGWLAKIGGGLAGAHPSQPNGAGALTAKDPKGSDKSPAAPGLKPGDAPPGGPKQGDPNSPGPGNAPMVNIENQNINHGDGGSQNKDMIRQLSASPMMN